MNKKVEKLSSNWKKINGHQWWNNAEEELGNHRETFERTNEEWTNKK